MFGVVAITGDTIVVGASREASNATGVNGNQNDDSALYAGAVYVFDMPGYASVPAVGSAINVGQADVGAVVTTTLTISETGYVALDVTSLAVSGLNAADFSVSPTSFMIADGGASQTVTITCTPAAAGLRAAALTVMYTGWGSPTTYALYCNVDSVVTMPLVMRPAP